MRSSLLLLATLPLVLGCVSNDSEAVKAELDQLLLDSPIVYHAGCDQLDACALDNRACTDVEAGMLTDLGAGKPIILEWEAPDTIVGIRTYYYAVQPDGSGTFYSDKRTDVASSDCGSYCGWHRESFSSNDLFDGSALRLSPSGADIQDFSLCGWP